MHLQKEKEKKKQKEKGQFLSAKSECIAPVRNYFSRSSLMITYRVILYIATHEFFLFDSN